MSENYYRHRLVKFCRASLLVVWLVPLMGYAAGEGKKTAEGQHHYDVGVLALRGHFQSNGAWQPTMDWLEAQIPNSKFELHTFTFQELDAAFKGNQLDFFLTSPGQATTFARQLPINWLATQKNNHGVPVSKAIASVVIVSKDSPFYSLDDIKGENAAAVSPTAFGGFLAIYYELDKLGYHSASFFKQIEFTGPPTDDLIRGVASGQFKVAILPACTLEQMANEGAIDKSQFRVLNQVEHPGFTCAVSTALYPNWTFAKTARASNDIGKLVTQALLEMPANAPAAIAAGNVGWTFPESTIEVDKVYKHFDLHPLQKSWRQMLREWVERNPLLAIVFMVMLVGVNLYTIILSRNFKRNQKVLKNTLEGLQQKSAMLEHAQRIMIVGELGSSLAHEINQPLSAIKNYSQGAKLRIERGQSPETILPALSNIQKQVNSASDIIQRLRGLIKNKPSRKRRFVLSVLVKDTYLLLAHDFRRHNIDLNLVIEGEPQALFGDYTGLQQLLLNLLNNAKDACIMLKGQESALRVTVNVTYKDKDVELTVTDNGVGFEQQPDDIIEQAFYTTKADGLGLGLAICRQVVESHNGSIKFDSVDPRGCRVVVVLPYQEVINENRRP